MRYSGIGYLIVEGFKNIFKNKRSTGASLMIMCATMFVFGVFFVIGENVNYIIKQVEEQQGMEVFIKDDATEEQIRELGEKIKSIEYINTTQYKTKEDALNHMKSILKDRQALLTGYEKDNPFPASYVVTLTNLEKSKEVQEQILTFDVVKSIQTRDDTINTLINIANAVRIASGAILVLLVFISIFIISNTIKLTVHARRKEISIMKYVGATNGFIRGPFMVEGIVIGLISVLISILIVGLIYNVVSDKIIESSITELISINFLTFQNMFNSLAIMYLVMGIGIGTIGSAISMRKYLDV